MPTILLNETTAHYQTWGSGETYIVMLHGWGADSSHYQVLGPLLAEAGFHVVVPDLPGWGGTDTPPRAYDVDDYVDWVNQFLNQLDIKHFALFGHSFGGRVAIKYSIQYSEQLTALILCAAAGIKTNSNTVKRKILRALASIGNAVFALPGINMFAPAARRWLYALAGSKDYLATTGVMRETIVKILAEDLIDFLPRINQPTLLLWGTEDGATPLSDGKKMHQLIASSQLVVIDGARHNLPKNLPDRVAKEVIAFTTSQSH